MGRDPGVVTPGYGMSPFQGWSGGLLELFITLVTSVRYYFRGVRCSISGIRAFTPRPFKIGAFLTFDAFFGLLPLILFFQGAPLSQRGVWLRGVSGLPYQNNNVDTSSKILIRRHLLIPLLRGVAPMRCCKG
ncbi:hypothetical protein CYPRO_1588 [Cyclonatronum proteinivorum]|uniref:Uncharacterized protein n=1 Tax=Cyclonatronum proteinivorum TaxID=1457365 RepID=A0A345UK37_9BACT|nr:hypothetical protein CYPRO_1588 [Cyclonatronum proteinivorum]